MFQNPSSSKKSAHANTEATVSGHCLDCSGKGMKGVSKKEVIFLSQKETLTWNVLANLETELEILVKEEKKEEELDLDLSCPRK